MQLLDCFSLPTVLVLSWLVVRARYRLSHIGGMALALMSVVAIVWIDVDDGKGGVGEGGGWDSQLHISIPSRALKRGKIRSPINNEIILSHISIMTCGSVV